MRLGTFNVWGLPKPFSDDVSSRTRVLASRLLETDVDVLLIQEAWTDEVRNRLSRGGLAAGFEVALASRESGGGLMVLSKLPILKNRFEKFRFRGDPERLSQGEFLGGKGFQTLRIDGPHGPFSLINTHLHARYRKERPELNSAVRTAQLLQLVGEVHRTEGTVVVGGDFNCSPNDPEYRVFEGLTGGCEAAVGREDLPTLAKSNFYKRHRTGKDKRIDFLFARPGARATAAFSKTEHLFAETAAIRGRDRSLSDHFGIASNMTLDIGAAASAAPGSRGTVRGKPDPAVLDLARGLIDVGREETSRREALHSRYAWSWAAAAAVAIGLKRHPAVDRRSFLRAGAGFLALSALAPAMGYTTLARVDTALKRDAFDDAQQILAQLEHADSRSV